MTYPPPPGTEGPSGYQPGEQVPPPTGETGFQPTGQVPPPPPGSQIPGEPAPAGRANMLTSRPVIGIGALIVGLVVGSGIGSANASKSDTAAPAPTVTVTETAQAEPTEEATEEATEEPTPEATEAPAKKSYKTLTSRKFKLMAKDPDSYIGKNYVIYGEITQFDSATGTDAFRADTGPKKLRISYGYVNYDQNSILIGTESKLAKLVEGDCFKAKVTVLGSYSYDTQTGGNTTVPQFQVDSISVYGSTD